MDGRQRNAEVEPDLRWLQGGELAALIAQHRWESTPLGPLAAWPPSLRTAVSLMLGSRHPMWIGWGEDMTFLYNDAYISVLGQAKHGWALGRPAREVWAEIWDVCGPLADKVFRLGESSYVDDVRLFMARGERLEETFYSFSYSPIRGEDGRVAGLFCPSAETTSRVLGARRAATLSALAAGALREKTTDRACAVAMQALQRSPDDIPFALLYRMEAGAAWLHEGSVGTLPAPLRPAQIPLSESVLSVWPIAEVAASGAARICRVPGEALIPGPGGQPIREVWVLPVLGGGDSRPVAVFVAGISPVRPLDAEYSSFFTLVASQVGLAIANAQAYESEARRARQLEELDRAKTVFFSNISHELRTPLTLIQGPVEDALNQQQDPGLRQSLEVVRRNTQRLQKLVNTLLDFSRIEAGRAQAAYEPVDLAALTTDVASTFRSLIEQAGLSLEVDCPPLGEEVHVDRDMWEKIVLNLLSNAFKFTLGGRIGVSLRRRGDQAELEVSDTGIGIPQHEIPRLFERFHRVEGVEGRSNEGSGIGLALVQELVRLHGGSITAQSEFGQGSRFRVAIPLGCAHLPQAQVVQPRRRSGGRAAAAFVSEAMQWLPDARTPVPAAAGVAAGGSGRRRILVVDDNADIRDYVQRLLERDYIVETANDGLAALGMAQRSPPDLVLSDVMMPRLDGFGLLRRLRESLATREVPVILLTARAGEESRIEGLGTGADDYMLKPFSGQELLLRVAANLELARMRRQAREETETLNEVSRTLLGELDLQRLVQTITDAGTKLTGASFGAFFYNVVDDKGESYTLYTLSGAPREAFEKFGLPRNTKVFAPTFNGTGVMRSDDILAHPDYGQNAPHHGMPPGHLPVRSYLAVPVISRSGEVLGGLFFGHAEPGRFDERCERIGVGIAAQAAVAFDNARLFREAERAERHLARHAAEQAALYRFADRLQRAVSFDDVYQAALEAIGAALGCSRASILLADAQGTLRFAAWSGLSPQYRRAVDGHSPWRAGEKQAAPIGIADVETSGLGEELRQTIAGEGIRALAFFPLVDERGVFGKFMAYYDTPHTLSKADLELGLTIAHQLAFGIERIRSEQERRQAEQALREADRRKDEFLATLAHELRNPLAPIRNVLEIARRHPRGELEPSARDIIERQTRHLVRLVDDLMDISRISRNKLELRVERVELGEVVRSAVETAGPLIGAAAQTLELALLPEAVPLDADAVRLAQVLSNLLNNASKFSPRGAVIRLSAELAAGEVVIRVRDRGIGIAPELLPQIFEPFVQGRRSADPSRGGLGIGLTLVQRLVALHGGCIEARSGGDGQGSEFIVHLPLAQRAGLSDLARQDAAALPAGTARRILIADDNLDSANSLGELFKLLGHEVAIAADGFAAAEHWSTFKPHFALLDIGMPKMDGYEVARLIRSKGGDTVLIAVTGWGQAEDRRRTREAGFDHHLVKPVDFAMVEKILLQQP